MQWRKSWLIPLLLIVLSGFPHPVIDLFQGHSTSHTVDQRYFTGESALGPYDLLQADGTLQFQVWRKLVFESWSRGEAPFWNPYVLAGTPLLANSQSGALYPPHVAVGLCRLPVSIGIDLLAWFHFALAALGIRAVAMRLGARELPAFVAGISFAGCSFMQAWMPIASVIATVAWIPWVLLGVAESFASFRPRWYRLPIFVGMMLLAGHLQFAAYGLLAAVIFGCFWCGGHWKELMWTKRISWLLGLALGVGLAMPQLLPVLTFSKNSHRQGVATETGYQAYAKTAIPIDQVVSRMVFPLAQGTNTVAAGGTSQPRFWPNLNNPALNYAETAVTIGPMALLGIGCLFAVRSQWKKLLGLLVVSVLAFLLMVGSPINRVLYFGLPGWSATGSPGRVMVLLLIGLVTVGAVVVSDAESLLLKKKAKVVMSGVMALLVVIAWMLMMRLPEVRNLAPEQVSELLGTNLTLATISLLILAAAAAWPFVRERGPMTCVLLVAPVIAINWLYSFGIRTYPEGSKSLPTTQNRVAIMNRTWPPRDAKEGLAPPNIAALQEIRQLGGYDSLLDRDTNALLRDVNGQDPAPVVNGNMMLIKPSSDLDKLAYAGVTEVWTKVPIPNLSPQSTDSGFFRYELEGPGRAFTPNGPAEVVSESLSHLMLRADGPGVLTLKDRNLAGWTVTVDGRESRIKGTFWREVELGPGSHLVEFRYIPPGYKYGLGLFALSAAMTAAISLAFSRPQTNSGTNP